MKKIPKTFFKTEKKQTSSPGWSKHGIPTSENRSEKFQTKLLWSKEEMQANFVIKLLKN